MLATFMKPALRACTAGRRSLYVCNAKNERKPAAPKEPASKATRKSKEKPDKIPRAPSAYTLYVKDAFPKVKKEHPDASFIAASELVRESWKTLKPEEKTVYESAAAESKALVAAKRAEIKAEKKANARPAGAFMLFSGKNRSSAAAANPGKSITEIASILGQEWKKLPEEEQQKYKDEAKALLDAWKAKQGLSA